MKMQKKVGGIRSGRGFGVEGWVGVLVEREGVGW